MKPDDVIFLMRNSVKVSVVPKCLRLFIKSNDDKSLVFVMKNKQVDTMDRILNPRVSDAINTIQSNSQFKRYKHDIIEANLSGNSFILVGSDREQKMADILGVGWRPASIYSGKLNNTDRKILIDRAANGTNRWKELSFYAPSPSLVFDFKSCVVRWDKASISRRNERLEGFYLNKMLDSCSGLYIPVVMNLSADETYMKCVDVVFKNFISTHGDIVKHIPAPKNKYHLFDIDHTIIDEEVSSLINRYGENSVWVYKVYVNMLRKKNPPRNLSENNKSRFLHLKEMVEKHTMEDLVGPYNNRLVP